MTTALICITQIRSKADINPTMPPQALKEILLQLFRRCREIPLCSRIWASHQLPLIYRWTLDSNHTKWNKYCSSQIISVFHNSGASKVLRPKKFFYYFCGVYAVKQKTLTWYPLKLYLCISCAMSGWATGGYKCKSIGEKCFPLALLILGWEGSVTYNTWFPDSA